MERPAAEASSERNGFQEEDAKKKCVGRSHQRLLQEFKYLSVNKLMKAGRVCNKWRKISEHPSLWKTIRITDTNGLNFEDLTKMLKKHRSIHLDLTKMCYSGINDGVWQNFVNNIRTVKTLKKFEMGRFPAILILQLIRYNRNLEVLNAMKISSKIINISPISSFLNLQELRLKSIHPDFTISSLTALSRLDNLKHLSLISITNLKDVQVDSIGDLLNLESLELGDCTDLPEMFGSKVLSKLKKLEKLRLVECQGNCFTFEILEAIKNMKYLTQLELINFEIVYTGFDLALGACIYVKKLMIIPISYSHAMSNRMIFGGALRLCSSLTNFYWGITVESLLARAKYYQNAGEKLPIQMPLPMLRDGLIEEVPPAEGPQQVEILTFEHFKHLVTQSLPETRVRIFKIPAALVSEQRIGDGIN